MRLPRVGITCITTLMTEEYGHTVPVDSALIWLSEALSLCGTVPVLIPLGVPSEIVGEYLKFLDGVVLTGGPDVGKVSNDRADLLKGGRDARKDRLEWHLCSLALSCGIPMLGICRGLQLINVYLGGTLYDDIGADCPAAATHNSRADEPSVEHEIQIAPASKLAAIFDGLDGRVNSYHHQAIDRLAPALRATARASDGIVEGVESVIYRSLLAVQFHPEVDYDRAPTSMNVFRWLADESRRFMAFKEGQGQEAFREERVG